MSHSVQVTLIADQYITLIGHEVNVHDLTVIHLDDSGVVCGYSTDEHTKLRSPAPAATVTGCELCDSGYLGKQNDDGRWMHYMGGDQWVECESQRLTPPAQGDEMRVAGDNDFLITAFCSECNGPIVFQGEPWKEGPHLVVLTAFCETCSNTMAIHVKLPVAAVAAVRGAGGEEVA